MIPWSLVSSVSAIVISAWLLSGLTYSLCTLLGGRRPPAFVRFLFNELRPFYLAAVMLNFIAQCATSHMVLNGWTDLFFAIQILNWFLFKDEDNDDDRWKRRREKVTDAVRQVGSRLTVVPAGAKS